MSGWLFNTKFFEFNTNVGIQSLYGTLKLQTFYISNSQRVEDYKFPSHDNPNVDIESQTTQEYTRTFIVNRDTKFSGFCFSPSA